MLSLFVQARKSVLVLLSICCPLTPASPSAVHIKIKFINLKLKSYLYTIPPSIIWVSIISPDNFFCFSKFWTFSSA